MTIVGHYIESFLWLTVRNESGGGGDRLGIAGKNPNGNGEAETREREEILVIEDLLRQRSQRKSIFGQNSKFFPLIVFFAGGKIDR